MTPTAATRLPGEGDETGDLRAAERTAAESRGDLTVIEVPLRPAREQWTLAVFLIAAGALGWFAAFELVVSKFELLENPGTDLACDYSVLVQCGKNLDSWQGRVFGFPNPLIGVGGFVAPIAVGVGLLSGARYARWFWVAFNLGLAGALAFVIWLISQSIYELGTLCPWCMVVWTVTIPLFWTVTARNLAQGVYGPRFRPVGVLLSTWVVLVTIACYSIVTLLAQLELNALGRL